MADAFIIMQIGNPELDEVCAKAIVPALEATGLSAKRVDKHNEGRLLKSEIVTFIQDAEIIVADLTNERPNCYLEVGYAMGMDRFRNLILTAREDHYHDSPHYVQGGAKIHFDLAGYDILFWQSGELDAFRKELERRIRRRRLVLAPTEDTTRSPWDEDWIAEQRSEAIPRFEASKKTGFMEARATLAHPKIDRSQTELDRAARESQIETFGWPIGVHLGNSDEYRPRPRSDGIFAVVAESRHFDYWAWRRNGDFFLFKSIFEDDRDPKKLFFDTRIVRVTELFMYCARQYTRLGVDAAHTVRMAVRHGGLRGRVIDVAASGKLIRSRAPTDEDRVETEVECTLERIETDLVTLVKQIVAPLLVVFDFFEVNDSIYEKTVNAFVKGRLV